MKIVFLSALLIVSGIVRAQQAYTGIVTDNRVSSLMATHNPSSIVDSKSKFAIGSFGNFSSISNFVSNDFRVYGTQARYREANKPGYKYSYTSIDILNLKYEFNHKNAFGYSLRYRDFNNTDGLAKDWSKSAAYGYSENTVNNPQDISGLRLTRLLFTEHNFTYARTIFDRNTSLLKGGITMKVLNGLDASYLYLNSGTGFFTDSLQPGMSTSGVDANFGVAKTKEQQFYENRGLGFDIGFTYEYRPDFEKQYYEMDGAKRNVRYDINKYKWKVTASLTDIGRIRYVNNPEFYNFNTPAAFVNAENIVNVNSMFRFPGTYVKDQVQVSSTKSEAQSDRFSMNLPASFHGGFDMNIIRNFYGAYNVSIPISSRKDQTNIRNYFIHTVTPRLEKENWSVMLPLSQMGNGRFYVGFAARVVIKGFSVFGGSNNLALLIGQKGSFSQNLFAGISYNVWYKVPKDSDGDKISDEKDDCPFDPGLPEFNGCPDTDGDGIMDKEDLCIYDKGPRSTNGCPDRDGDGIIDMNDMCPDEKGLGIHYGCPDRDKDGVIDAADRCPDVPGVELNNGCPIEIRGCCLDSDGDNILDEVDKCPDVPGSIYNFGCPVDSSNLEKIRLQQEKEKKDANNTGQQVKDNPAIDLRKDLITSQDELTALLAGKNIIRNHATYFAVDDATISEEEQKRLDAYVKSFPKKEKLAIILIGYTDRDGSLDYNLALSKRRAETIQRKLADYYKFDPKQITVYYFGETKSIHKGEYSKEQKQADRKVEIKLVRLPK